MTKQILTDAKVRNAPARDRRYSIMDGKEAGLEVRVCPDGRRVFALRASLHGKDVRLTIGPYGIKPPLWTLERARLEAARLKLRLREEGDFRREERQAEQAAAAAAAYTIADLCRDWEADAETRLRASTMALHRTVIKNHIKPTFGGRTVGTLTRAEVKAHVKALAAKHGRTANLALQMIGTLHRFARNEMERKDVDNPAEDMTPPHIEKPRERVLSDAELRTFWTALESPETAPSPLVAAALRIALYSGQRIGEVLGMRENELDFDMRVWAVPPTRTKSGDAHRVPLTPKLTVLIRQALTLRGERDAADAPVFEAPATKDALTRQVASIAMQKLCAKLEGFERATPHDLRRTARTLLAREHLGVSFDDAERTLSHVVGSKISRTYNHHDYIAERRRALEKLGQELDRIIAGRPLELGDNVVSLEARG